MVMTGRTWPLYGGNTLTPRQGKGYGHSNMSDYHEMWENLHELVHDYDPDYPIDGGRDDHDNHPVGPDDWARNNEDLEGGF